MFKCKTCKVLEEQNTYLRTLLDRILVSKGISPVEADTLFAQQTSERIENEDTSPQRAQGEQYGH